MDRSEDGNPMRYLSLFSGIEAATVAWKPMGWECVGLSEIEPFPCAVLNHYYPGVRNYGDVTKITESDVIGMGKIDLIVGGFPCQDLSVAGKRAGLENDGEKTRSGLFHDAIRIVRWAREHCGLRFLLIENVPGLMSSSKGEDFAVVLREMVGVELAVPDGGWKNSGLAIGPEGMVEWVCLDAKYFGVPQRRRRIFALADFGDWENRPPILLERESLQGNFEKGGKTAERVALSVTVGPPFSRTGNERSECEALIPTSMRESGQGYWMEDHLSGTIDANMGMSGHANRPAVIAHTLRSGGDGGIPSSRGENIIGFYPTNRQPDFGNYENVSPAVKVGSGGKCGNPPAVAFPINGMTIGKELIDRQTTGIGKDGDPCPSLRGSGHQHAVAFTMNLVSAGRKVREDDQVGGLSQSCHLDPHNNQESVVILQPPAVAFCQNTRDEVQGGDGQVTGALAAEPGMKQQTYVAFSGRDNGRDANIDIAPTMRSCHDEKYNRSSGWSLAMASGMAVRRLLPVECARLQGFPDTYLDIEYKGKPAADGPKYKALGNSMAVPVIRWIGKRISATLLPYSDKA